MNQELIAMIKLAIEGDSGLVRSALEELEEQRTGVRFKTPNFRGPSIDLFVALASGGAAGLAALLTGLLRIYEARESRADIIRIVDNAGVSVEIPLAASRADVEDALRAFESAKRVDVALPPLRVEE